ncbi:hypothetical protein B0H65DRAFT_445135 [Neurospora tetraspora]|uniref:Uncharacterized protein n=1 Tax=Neurospora tetraspora TaxID=94610 RepID=A0AAE0J8A0_9PEZI|nr:hypothetical protein B0H65DRAFT_445135 [Neurospora tetraspora]
MNRGVWTRWLLGLGKPLKVSGDWSSWSRGGESRRTGGCLDGKFRRDFEIAFLSIGSFFVVDVLLAIVEDMLKGAIQVLSFTFAEILNRVVAGQSAVGTRFQRCADSGSNRRHHDA